MWRTEKNTCPLKGRPQRKNPLLDTLGWDILTFRVKHFDSTSCFVIEMLVRICWQTPVHRLWWLKCRVVVHGVDGQRWNQPSSTSRHSSSRLWFKTTLADLCHKFSLRLPSRGWCTTQKQLLNSQSISSQLMAATLGQSPIGWWRMLCGQTAAAKNTITRLLWPCYGESEQTSRLWWWKMDTRLEVGGSV